jgi:cation diffusion facilitator family transporter
VSNTLHGLFKFAKRNHITLAHLHQPVKMQFSPAIRITCISIAVNLLLGICKCITGALVGSRALIADGLHSLSDLATDAAVIAGLVIANREEDEGHPFGHHKFSSFARLFVGAMLLLFAIGLIISAIVDVRGGSIVNPGWIAFTVALISLVAKEVLFYWTRYWAHKLQSELLLANAWHHRSDSVSSLAVLAALIGVQLGGPNWSFLDSLVAIVLGVFILVEAIRITRSAFNDLVDAAPPASIIEDLREHILPTKGVQAYHDLRIRRIGDVFEMDVHIQVDPQLTVEAGHAIARELKANLILKHPEIQRVLVHVEPATDEHLIAKGLYGE